LNVAFFHPSEHAKNQRLNLGYFDLRNRRANDWLGRKVFN